ncbi:MAG: SPOR domain-containing protein [bacterium]|nr:SPOR domain-containing protein [bacterium]
MIRRLRSIFLLALCGSLRLHASPMDEGERAYLARDYRTALQQYNKALTYDLSEQNRARCWFMIGQANLMLGNTHAARQAFGNIKTRYAKTDWLGHAYLGLGDAYYRDKNYAASLAAYKDSLSARFASQYAPSVYYRMARCYRALRNANEATRLERLIRTSYPESLEARLLLSGASRSTAPFSQSASQRQFYAVQVAFTPHAEYAAHFAARLKSRGYSAYVDRATVQRQVGYRVLVGRFQGPEAAQALAARLKSKEKVTGFVIAVPTD